MTDADVRHIASLARLRVDAAAAARLAEELTGILAYVEQLDPGHHSVPEPRRVSHGGPVPGPHR